MIKLIEVEAVNLNKKNLAPNELVSFLILLLPEERKYFCDSVELIKNMMLEGEFRAEFPLNRGKSNGN